MYIQHYALRIKDFNKLFNRIKLYNLENRTQNIFNSRLVKCNALTFALPLTELILTLAKFNKFENLNKILESINVIIRRSKYYNK